MKFKQFDQNAFVENLKKARRDVGISQEAMCELAELARCTVSAWENKKNMPSVASLYQLCITFNVSMDWLCGLSNVKEIRHDEN